MLSSLQALIAEDLEKHVEDFADDFESDFDDGGSAAAHVQLLGHVKRAGGLEGMAMSLEDLEWTADERTVEFRKIVIYMANGKLVLSYKLKSTDHGWKAIHLETE